MNTEQIAIGRSVLARVADKFEADKQLWIQQAYSRFVAFGLVEAKQCFCAVGAICHDTGEHPTEIGSGSKMADWAIKLLADTVLPTNRDNPFEDPEGRVIVWNDDDARTVDEVIAAMRKAAEYRG
jgi:hypothetical protein